VDMNLTTACVVPSVTKRLTVLCLLAYPLILVGLAKWKGNGTGILASAVPAILTPLLLGATGAWLGTAHLIQAVSISEAGRRVRAAYAAETSLLLCFAAAIAALVSITLFIADLRGKHASASTTVSRPLSFASVTTAAVLLSFHLAATLMIVEDVPGLLPSFTSALTMATIAVASAIGSFLWLVLGCRRPSLTLRAARGVIPGALALASLLTAYMNWQLALIWESVAIHG